LPKGKELAYLAGHKGYMACASFSGDSALLVTGDTDGNVRLWDVAKRKLRKAFGMKVHGVGGVAFMPDGKSIAIGYNSGTVNIVDLSGELLRSWKAKDNTRHLALINASTIAPPVRF
jgi:WD40 repeat protein